MDILNSDWLIQMLRKSGKTPEIRLLSLFDILDNWTDAPGISEQFKIDSLCESNALKTYLSLEAGKAGAALPEMLAAQLHMMAVSAICEKLLSHNKDGLTHAKSAADALIRAQTKKEFHIARSSVYAIAASFIGTLIITGSILLYHTKPFESTPKLAGAVQTVLKPVISNATASPQNTVALMKQIEQMRTGNCRLLEAIQLPDRHKSIYFKNIVLGQISTDPTEQKLVKELLDKIRCNYTPMLMKKST